MIAPLFIADASANPGIRGASDSILSTVAPSGRGGDALNDGKVHAGIAMHRAASSALTMTVAGFAALPLKPSQPVRIV
jgi:hypothetical protein